MIEHVVVMAASPNREMEALTKQRPKAMLPLLGRPLVARVMDSFYEAGVRHFTVVIGEAEGAVAMWLAENWYVDASVKFAPLGHQRGTAASLFAARSMIDGPFVIASIDVIIPSVFLREFLTFFEERDSYSAALCLFHAPDEIYEAAGVLLDPLGQVMFIAETSLDMHQQHNVPLPVYAFKPDILDYLAYSTVDGQSGGRPLAAIIQAMIEDKKLVGAVQADERIRVRKPSDLHWANRHLLEGLRESTILSKVADNVTVVPPVYIGEGVMIGDSARIGPNVYIEAKSKLGQGVKLKDSVVLGVRIGAKKYIDDALVYEDQM